MSNTKHHNTGLYQDSSALNYQKTVKEFMSQDEITVMDGENCIFQLLGVRPFYRISLILLSIRITNS